MLTDTVIQDFKRKVCEEVRLLEEGNNRFRVFTPFRFDDGDHLSIVLKKEDNEWLISDEGHTYLHLSYKIHPNDLFSGTRWEIIESTLAEFQVEDRLGELIMRVENDRYGNAFYNFTQALIKISDITYLSRERVKSTFYEDFKALIEENIPKERYDFEWHDEQVDPEGVYTVDCHINNLATPLYLYAINSDNKMKDTAISIFQFEKWDKIFKPVAIFEDETKMTKKALKKFSKICTKQFPSLENNQANIIEYLKKQLQSV
ncbi:DUF1828 domain-containing protein [Euhalothece natronophila Z-M001]|uniref:DUF1828 domain-containing protein n=1 Tax=Euhalothece natronophila Z-M001 TaxID=522448 RepID=A0A5B8NIH8_9CHRO|nr:DUF1828 domain-containing protein [Euhalothece natronophila]QDZ39043.1 DUF1828 domain-containing protein [Euhalothece natronophila Z-M001]